MEAKEKKSEPVALEESEVEIAAKGKSEEVVGKRKPMDFTEEEVKLASEGKSEEVLAMRKEKPKKKSK